MSTGIKEERKKIQRAIEHLTQHERKDLVYKELVSLQRYLNGVIPAFTPMFEMADIPAENEPLVGNVKIGVATEKVSVDELMARIDSGKATEKDIAAILRDGIVVRVASEM